VVTLLETANGLVGAHTHSLGLARVGEHRVPFQRKGSEGQRLGPYRVCVWAIELSTFTGIISCSFGTTASHIYKV
jgi:hypothetical protein